MQPMAQALGDAISLRWTSPGAAKETLHPLPHAKALSSRPDADPLRDGQFFAGCDSADGVFEVKRNGDGLDWLRAVAAWRSIRITVPEKIVPAALDISGSPRGVIDGTGRRRKLWKGGEGPSGLCGSQI